VQWKTFRNEEPKQDELVVVFLKENYIVATYSKRGFIKEWIPHDRKYSITCFLNDQWYHIDPHKRESPCQK
jgi:hypothetical protein